MRSGWVTARTMPAMALASTWREAKPTTAAAIALEASTVAASRSRLVNCARARATPMTMIAASTTRRRKRRRVSSIGLSSAPPSASGSLCARPRMSAVHDRDEHERREQRQAGGDLASPDDESAATMRAVMARDGIPSAVLLDALGTLVELETPWPHLVRRARRARRGGRREDARARDAGRDGLLPRPPRRGARLGRRSRTCAGAAPPCVQERAGHARCRSADVAGRAAGGDPLPRLPRGARRARAPARRRRAPGRRLQLGRLAARRARAHRPARARRRRRHLGRARRGQARPGDLPRRARAAGRARPPTRCTSATASRPTSRARARRACEAVLVARNGAAARPTACASSPRSTAC